MARRKLLLPEEAQKEASKLVRRAIVVVSEQTSQMAESLREFDVKKRYVEEELKRGARRTTGRIV